MVKGQRSKNPQGIAHSRSEKLNKQKDKQCDNQGTTKKRTRYVGKKKTHNQCEENSTKKTVTKYKCRQEHKNKEDKEKRQRMTQKIKIGNSRIICRTCSVITCRLINNTTQHTPITKEDRRLKRHPTYKQSNNQTQKHTKKKTN